MKNKNKEINNKIRKRLKRISTFIGSFIIIYLLLVTAIAPQRYDYKVGDIASSDIKATRDTIDEEATKEKQDEAAKAVSNKYTVDTEVRSNAEKSISDLFDCLRKFQDSTEGETFKISSIKDICNLNDEQCKVLLKIPKNDISKYEGALIKVIDKVYDKNIEDGNEESIQAGKEYGNDEVDKLGYSSTTLNSVFKAIISSQVKANLFYDEEETEKAKKEARENTENITIKKTQIIVSEGEPITDSQIKILQSLGLLSNNANGVLIIYFLLGIYVAMILYIQNWYIYKNYKNIYYDSNKIVLINLITVISIFCARFIGIASPYLIPIVCAPLLMTLLINYKISIFINVMSIFFLAPLVEFNAQIILVSLLSAVLGSTFVKKMQQRNDILIATIVIAIIGAMFNFAIGMLLSSNMKEVFINSLITIAGTVLSGVLAIGFLPFLETMFNVVTTLKLLELSNPNSPLLKKLLMEAPGTYHHSMIVANLAEMASEEVGANSVIARIGAYYHDVGKIARPYFFKENQIYNENPHDKINGNLSALIILSHVKDGVEMAEEYKIPKVIIDIIKEHHGTTLVKYFYYNVKNNAENPDDVKKEDFQYKGPIPSTKESGIIMLADSCEAAVRSLKDSSPEKIEEMVKNIIDDKLRNNQLDNCELTLKDIKKIRECFLKAFGGIYHKRIEYPTEKKVENDKTGGQ